VNDHRPTASVAEGPPKEAPKEWSYLATPAFQTRYILASWYLERYPDVVEIGGYRTPITTFFRTPKRSVTVLDPRIVPAESDTVAGSPCRVRHLPLMFQDFDGWPERYGLALLGLDFELYELTRRRRREVLDRFEAVVRRADRIVIEVARDWPASRWLADWVEKTTGFDRVLQVTLDLKGDLGIDLSGSWPPFFRRTLVVLDRQVAS